ncbi:nuclear transport factor 2 family protein [Acidicapsa ligni]|uniref:nuclear transport factor 2 family protein n=1 Tax=Acidicapsa ligni TaxID=542300 RepID=UPI0021E072A1|nr:nuclear transport factor 2 family protein [Acidicapsa ligni]
MSDERTIQQVLAKYVRGADRRDGAAVAELFTDDGKVEIFYSNSGNPEPMGEIVGPGPIATAVSQMMRPHPPGGWSHHTTHDPIIEVIGDRATLDAQFIVFSVQAKEKPEGGWPADALGVQGSVTPIESGYYRPILHRVGGGWKIQTLRIVMDMPIAFPRH